MRLKNSNFAANCRLRHVQWIIDDEAVACSFNVLEEMAFDIHNSQGLQANLASPDVSFLFAFNRTFPIMRFFQGKVQVGTGCDKSVSFSLPDLDIFQTFRVDKSVILTVFHKKLFLD